MQAVDHNDDDDDNDDADDDADAYFHSYYSLPMAFRWKTPLKGHDRSHAGSSHDLANVLAHGEIWVADHHH